MHFIDFSQQVLQDRITSALFKDTQGQSVFLFSPEYGTFRLVLPDSVNPPEGVREPLHYWESFGLDKTLKDGYKVFPLNRTLDFTKVEVLAVEYTNQPVKWFTDQDESGESE